MKIAFIKTGEASLRQWKIPLKSTAGQTAWHCCAECMHSELSWHIHEIWTFNSHMLMGQVNYKLNIISSFHSCYCSFFCLTQKPSDCFKLLLFYNVTPDDVDSNPDRERSYVSYVSNSTCREMWWWLTSVNVTNVSWATPGQIHLIKSI